MNLTPLTGLLAAAALWLGAAGSAQAAKGVNLSCGDTITTDTRLANDLIDCPGIGVVIGADDITLDLNGHTIDGDGVSDFEGVSNIGHDGVTVQGGSIRDFVEGVAVLFAADNSVRDLSLSRMRHVGVFVSDSTDVQVATTSSTAVAFSGIFVTRSQDVDIERNVVRDSGSGIGARLSARLRIAENTTSHNENEGILLFDDTADAAVEHNAVSGNGAGIVVAADGNLLSRNRVFANGDNIVIDGGSDNRVIANEVVNAVGFPDDPAAGFGILVTGGDRNALEDNDITGAASNGIRLTAFDEAETGAADANVVRANRVRRAGLDGYLVDENALGTLLERNRAVAAGDDGIDIESPSTTVAENVADANRDLGIEAVPGVIDGGGNRAHGNGNPLGCVNVLCG